MRVESISAVLCTLLALPLVSCTRVVAHANTTPTEGVPVRTERVLLEDVPLEIAAVGNVEAIESVDVKPRVAGQIGRVAFTEGQQVTKGQLLFAIDRDTLARQQAQQQAELDRDTAVELQSKAVVARDAASEKQRKSEAEIAKKLGDLGVLSGQSVRQTISVSDAAIAGVEADQAAVAAAAGAVKADHARLAQTQLQLDFADVAAPISGRAGAAMVKTGNMVRENDTTLVTILQLSPIRVTFGVPEQSLADVRQLSARGPLEVEAITGTGSAAGHLDFIDNTVDAATGTVRLKAIFANTDAGLWPGEFVNVRLRLRMEKSRLVVPESAVQQGADGQYAWRVDSNQAAMVPITVERSYKQQAANGSTISLAVLSGGELRPGETVVTEGQLRLIAGARVSPISARH